MTAIEELTKQKFKPAERRPLSREERRSRYESQRRDGFGEDRPRRVRKEWRDDDREGRRPVDLPKMPAPVYDPIFDAPYEPTETTAETERKSAGSDCCSRSGSRQEKGRVAALLGGLLRK